jgi:hypothetical protein
MSWRDARVPQRKSAILGVADYRIEELIFASTLLLIRKSETEEKPTTQFTGKLCSIWAISHPCFLERRY